VSPTNSKKASCDVSPTNSKKLRAMSRRSFGPCAVVERPELLGALELVVAAHRELLGEPLKFDLRFGCH